MPFIPIVEERICEQHDGSIFIRRGSCNQCGECCKSGDPFSEVQTMPPTPCALLGQAEDGLYICTNREHPYYLTGCNIWPTHPDHIRDYPSCSYTFFKED